MNDDPVGVTAALANFVHDQEIGALPPQVLREGSRALFNFIGCALGGQGQPALEIALGLARDLGRLGTGEGADASSSGMLTLIGRRERAGALDAAYLNCFASAAHAFDDTHLATVIHPTGPVAAAALAVGEALRSTPQVVSSGNDGGSTAPPVTVSGREVLTAIAIGMEVECRIGCGLLLPPAEGEVGWYITGVAGGIGAAVAAARLLGLDPEQIRWAIGIAGNQACGFRQTHGSMCTSFVPAHAARAGLEAALLARRGFSASDASIEGRNGLAQVFARAPSLEGMIERLGQHWEMLATAYKPYPCGIVIHPVLEACLQIAEEGSPDVDAITRVHLAVDPLCLTLCDRPEPLDAQQAQVSVQHWTAAALAHGRAGLEEGNEESVRDPSVGRLRARVDAVPDETVGREGCRVRVELEDGSAMEKHIKHCIGSVERPMTDAELEAKFRAQSARVLAPSETEALVEICRRIDSSPEVVELLRRCVPSQS